MKTLAIKAENISKQYRLGEVGTGTLSHDLNRFISKIRGKEDPYLKIGETNDRTIKGHSDYVWSLKDINFEIEQGDAVGIIGRNGAGKSTLLKLLSKVTKPTTGNIKINGRIASLLEVGTGFNPEMTGRENIYMNGSMLGMRRHEIKRKFDEIVEFAGVEKYIDTPAKRYSSGMYVRLAFSVAAHLESEILIVDEVLSVGDAEFQKKCLGKMGNVSKGEGRTVLFVSHNMGAVSTLCNKGIYLDKGSVFSDGKISDVLNDYRNSLNNHSQIKQRFKLGKLEIDNFKFSKLSLKLNDPIIRTGDSINFKFQILNLSNTIKNVEFNCEIYDSNEVAVFCIGNDFNKKKVTINPNVKIEINIDFKINLLPDKYYLKFFLVDMEYRKMLFTDPFFAFEVEFGDFFGTGKIPDNKLTQGLVIPEFELTHKEI
jgi:lipopolysaccharide transport system ATP-binding protein